MGVFTDMFGSRNRTIPRISVVEAFVENPEYTLSAPDVEKITGVSRRAAYYIIQQLVDEGILEDLGRKGKSEHYGLNSRDVRVVSLVHMEKLLTIGKLESEIKRFDNIDQTDLLTGSVLWRMKEIPRARRDGMTRTRYQVLSPESEIARPVQWFRQNIPDQSHCASCSESASNPNGNGNVGDRPAEQWMPSGSTTEV